jgi:hypothetical protein
MDNPVTPPDWVTIPAPIDDGVASHLPGRILPSSPLLLTAGASVR